jgi:PAS domain S-box-containing protein
MFHWPVTDIAGRPVARLIGVWDKGPLDHATRQHALTVFVSCALTGLLLLGLVYRRLSRMDRLLWRMGVRTSLNVEKRRAILNTAREGFLLVDPRAQRILEVNDALCRMVGAGRKELVGLSPQELAVSPDQILFPPPLLENRGRAYHVYTVQLKDGLGNPLAARFSATALRDATGLTAEVFAFITDPRTDGTLVVEEAARREKTLREMVEKCQQELRIQDEQLAKEVKTRKRAWENWKLAEDWLLNVQRFAELGYWEWDLITGECRGSDRLYRLLQLSRTRHELSYDQFLERVSPQDRVGVASRLRECAASGHPVDLECRVLPAIDGMPDAWVRIIGESIMEDQRPRRMYGIVWDITRCKRALPEAGEPGGPIG